MPLQRLENTDSHRADALETWTNNNHADALETLASAVESEMKKTIEADFLSTPRIHAEQELGQNTVYNIKVDLGVS